MMQVFESTLGQYPPEVASAVFGAEACSTFPLESQTEGWLEEKRKLTASVVRVIRYIFCFNVGWSEADYISMLKAVASCAEAAMLCTFIGQGKGGCFSGTKMQPVSIILGFLNKGEAGGPWTYLAQMPVTMEGETGEVKQAMFFVNNLFQPIVSWLPGMVDAL
jgi:hypothetical protein